MRTLNIVMHSTKPLSELQQSAIILAPRVGEILFRAILFASESSDWKTTKYSFILPDVSFRLELQGLLIGGQPDSLGPDGQDPHFEIRQEITSVSLTNDGKPTFETKLCLKLLSPTMWS